MSINCTTPIPLRLFEPKSASHELENGAGIIRIALGNTFHDLKDSESWFLEFCRKLGTPVSQSAEGELVLSIRDQSLGQNDPKTRGPNTNKKLGFHTDRCDVIAFLCLIPAMTGGENQVVDSREVERIIKRERPDLHSVLKQKFPYKRHVVDRGNQKPFVMQPIFSEFKGFFACSYLRVLIDRADQNEDCPSLNESQRKAINFLDEVCERTELQLRFTMKSGEILLLNNWTSLHRRTSFEDSLDPQHKRHLLRVWLSMPNSRPLDSSFIENFGTTEAGAIRGGMKPNF
jgi:hypothetical protein